MAAYGPAGDRHLVQVCVADKKHRVLELHLFCSRLLSDLEANDLAQNWPGQRAGKALRFSVPCNMGSKRPRRNAGPSELCRLSTVRAPTVIGRGGDEGRGGAGHWKKGSRFVECDYAPGTGNRGKNGTWSLTCSCLCPRAVEDTQSGRYRIAGNWRAPGDLSSYTWGWIHQAGWRASCSGV